jgi:6-phosphogluconolactonase
MPSLRVVPSDEVSATAAEVIAATLSDAVAARGEAHWATTGGSAAPGMYAELVAADRLPRVPWDRVHVWWGDDRFVPYDHPESNVRPFDVALLGTDHEGGGPVGVPIRPAQVHRWPIPQAIAEGTGPAGAAAADAAELRRWTPRDGDGVPVLDLVVLGVGPDGHVLSVFPGSPVWDTPGITAPVPAPTHVEPHIERVTFHPRLVRAARSVLVVTSGASKADNLAAAWTGDDARELPLRAARLATATWVVDEAAAARLPTG